MFDVDHFKRCNDRFGHDAGDTVLRTISGLVQGHIRAGDVACRFGGEEFVLLQTGMSAGDALRRAEVLRGAVAELSPEHHGTTLETLTISLGVATTPSTPESETTSSSGPTRRSTGPNAGDAT